MKIHAIQTGTVQVHERQRSGAGHGVFRFVNTLMDTEWTEGLPIYAYLIEHPEGPILVDTGETARAAEPGYFPRWHPYFRWGVREQVAPEQEIGPRLRELGFEPRDVRVVLTHMHTDHAGGLDHFPDSEIFVSRREIKASSGLVGRLRGFLPNRWPRWFDPTQIDFEVEPVGAFSHSFPLTAAGDVRLLPTPGHTAGHLSVLVERGDHRVLLAGDASYSERNLVAGIVDGVSSLGGGEDVARRSLARILALARERPLVYLPAHDPEARRRLLELRFTRPESIAVRSAA